MTYTILDCYTDEPAGLGVPPYLGTYPRYIAGYLNEDVHYLTIDDLRLFNKNNSIVKIIPNRKEAIFFCLREIRESKESNVLLIAGKGHESYQDILGRKSHFNDHEEVKEFLEKI